MNFRRGRIRRRLFTLDGNNPMMDGTLHVWEVATGRELISIPLKTESIELVGSIGSPLGGMWMEGERLHIGTLTGVRVFDGTPFK